MPQKITCWNSWRQWVGCIRDHLCDITKPENCFELATSRHSLLQRVQLPRTTMQQWQYVSMKLSSLEGYVIRRFSTSSHLFADSWVISCQIIKKYEILTTPLQIWYRDSLLCEITHAKFNLTPPITVDFM